MTRARSIFNTASSALVLLAGHVGVPVWADPTPAAGTPRIEVESPTQDLGVIPRGQPAEARFTIGNAGDGVLNILQAKPG